ncbi:hypothetical protein [Paucimonas lemoignei]|nr:hypothetical protein [Paucimonas lemoignei]
MALLASCGEKKPSSNTEEYKEAHGILKNKISNLRIKGVLLSIPPELYPNPYSYDRIVRGQADKVTIHINLNSWLDQPTTVNSETLGLVRVEIGKHGYESDEKIEEYFNARKWASINRRPELDLIEYVEVGDSGGWGYRTFESTDPLLRTPNGGRLVFNCVGLPGKNPSQCRTFFQHQKGVLISYYLSGHLLKKWKDVHKKVIATVNDLIVQE